MIAFRRIDNEEIGLELIGKYFIYKRNNVEEIILLKWQCYLQIVILDSILGFVKKQKQNNTLELMT